MSKLQLLLLLLLAVVPLALLGWIGSYLARGEDERVRQQLQALLTEQLRESEQSIARRLDGIQAVLLIITQLDALDAEYLRAVVRSQPLVGQLFVLEPDGDLLHPPAREALNQGEREFLQRARMFLLDRDLVRLADRVARRSRQEPSENQAAQQASPRAAQSSTDGSETHGWYVWYWGRGLHLIFWRRRADGRIVGVDVDRSRWMAELVAALPDSDTAWDELSPPSSSTRSPLTNVARHVRLVDSQQQTVYQWGEPEPHGAPLAQLPLRPPLEAWRLQYFLDGDSWRAFRGRGAYFQLVSGLVVAACGVVGLAAYLYRETTRQAREAATRVNFVNQVSHELKTPLTNIRLYADLLDTDLQTLDDADAGPARQRLEVILAECRRLSRLIGNVLTFARQQRRTDVLHPRAVRPDDVIRDVCRQFAPSLDQKKIALELALDAERPTTLDRDAVEQILVNLVGNVEKYAASGGWLRIASRQDGDRTTIVVADRGPGVPPAARERIFRPFVRLDDRLEGSTGTGIGLTIARRLARQHGGDVRWTAAEHGAAFEVELHSRTPSPS